MNQAGQDIQDESYFNLPSLSSYISGSGASSVLAALGAGSAWDKSTGSGNYYVTTNQYDDLGNLDKTVDADGNIARTVYGEQERKTSTWVGTNDTPSSGYWSPTNNGGTSNMVEISATVYDNGGIGDGNVTESIQFPDGNSAAASTFRVTQTYCDWQDRQIATKSGAAVEEVSPSTSGQNLHSRVLATGSNSTRPRKALAATRRSVRSYYGDNSITSAKPPAEYAYAGNGISLSRVSTTAAFRAVLIPAICVRKPRPTTTPKVAPMNRLSMPSPRADRAPARSEPAKRQTHSTMPLAKSRKPMSTMSISAERR